MNSAILVDDEPYCCEALQLLIERYCPEITVTHICHSGKEALRVIHEKPPDILFLDIEMPQMNGFELLKRIGDFNFHLIFTTSFDQYAIKAIRFSALDYLLKPIDRDELQAAVKKCVQARPHNALDQLDILLKNLHPHSMPFYKIALPTLEGLQMIAVDSIISCGSESNYTLFSLKGNQKILISRTLKEVEEMLEEFNFIRVHHSSVINLNEVNKYVRGEGGYLVMSDGSSIDVSRSRKDTLLRRLKPDKH
ncbi:LytR/AlgR family response regulator transcription factor [Flavihumibacter petaseus]|uniref:Putative two-component response regulator n=1 Tax=Flavihumibacter petaseus NBRC 106054 TaxID=1220578 RepID=A0A0E9MY73_9BACT|nr:LytTR family DNA-binding domain-containing protein [Flavihumibacter petaseus]GAO42539.1 putative two-component response regulator [Flavihumibacter petaseus NBRC 106054]